MTAAVTTRKLQELSNRRDEYTSSVISAVSQETETISVSGFGDVLVPHQNVFGTSWIRSAPNAGQGVKLAYDKKKKKFEAIGYEQPADVAKKLDLYRNKQGVYRPLKPGEHEIVSSGGAVSFWGSQPFAETRVGPIRQTLDGLKLEATTKAPAHVLKLHSSRTDSIGDEIRFGVVKRPISANSEAYGLKAPISNPLLDMYHYGKEFLLNIKDDMSNSPLVDIRTGDVFEDQLLPGFPFSLPKLGDNIFPLRYWARFYNTIEPGSLSVPDQYTEVQIDTMGNMVVNLSKLALLGYTLNAPLGKIAMSCGLTMALDAKLGITITSLADVTVKGLAGVKVTSPLSVNIEGTTSVDMKSTGPVTIEGTASVDVKSTGAVTVSGTASVDMKSTGAINVSGTGGVTIKSSPGTPLKLQGSAYASLSKHIDYTTGIPLFPDGQILL